MKKFEETRVIGAGGGFGGGSPGVTETRVISIKDDETPPEGAKHVPNDTPAHDWKAVE